MESKHGAQEWGLVWGQWKALRRMTGLHKQTYMESGLKTKCAMIIWSVGNCKESLESNRSKALESCHGLNQKCPIKTHVLNVGPILWCSSEDWGNFTWRTPWEKYTLLLALACCFVSYCAYCEDSLHPAPTIMGWACPHSLPWNIKIILKPWPKISLVSYNLLLEGIHTSIEKLDAQ